MDWVTMVHRRNGGFVSVQWIREKWVGRKTLGPLRDTDRLQNFSLYYIIYLKINQMCGEEELGEFCDQNVKTMYFDFSKPPLCNILHNVWIIWYLSII